MNVEHQMLDPEIVMVVSHCRLIDSQSEERIYWRRNGQGLAAGFYVVTWPAGSTRPSFNEDAVFQGPFRSLVDAQSALDRASVRAGLQAEASRAAAPPRSRAKS